MTRQLLTGNGAAAWAARLAKVDYVPAFPITPQTEIIETLSAWFDNGEIPGRMTTLESAFDDYRRRRRSNHRG